MAAQHSLTIFPLYPVAFRLAEFDFEVRYKKVKDNLFYDALSRLLTRLPTVEDDEG